MPVDDADADAVAGNPRATGTNGTRSAQRFILTDKGGKVTTEITNRNRIKPFV